MCSGDLAAPDIQSKAEDKVRPCTRRPAPKPPSTNGANSRGSGQAAAGDSRARPHERQPPAATHAFSSPRNQRRGGGVGGGGRGRGAGRGPATMRERSSGDSKGRDGVTAAKEERKAGRLCEESKAKERERPGHPRPREANGLKSWPPPPPAGRGKVCAKGDNRGGRVKSSNVLSNHRVYLTAMVVPRTPVAPRNQDKTRDRGDDEPGEVIYTSDTRQTEWDCFCDAPVRLYWCPTANSQLF